MEADDIFFTENNAVEGGQETEAAASSISVVDVHLNDTAIATVTASEAIIGLFDAPTNGEGILKELADVPDASPNQQPEASPDEINIDVVTATVNLRLNGGVTLDFGNILCANQESMHDNQDNSAAENFDLMGFESPGDGHPTDNEAAQKNPVAIVDPKLDIFGMSYMTNETQNLSNEETPGKDLLGVAAGSHDVADLLKANVSAEALENTQHHDGGFELINPIAGKDTEDLSVVDVKGLENESLAVVVDTVKLETERLEDERLAVKAEASTLKAAHLENERLTAESTIFISAASVESTGEPIMSEDIQSTEIYLEQQMTDMKDINDITPEALPVIPVAEMNSSRGISQQTLEPGFNFDGNACAEHVNEVVEDRTEEEEEWLSMGLGLGDALRQIVALTDERDLALVICQEKDERRAKVEALVEEVQFRLEAEMNRRAESDSELRKGRETMKSYDEKLKGYESEKLKFETEVARLREMTEESEQRVAVLSNRLNEAKKKEANKASTAGRLDAENEQLREDLQTTQNELDRITKAKAKLEANMEKLKQKAVERVKQAETALAEERELNEERKKKMKTFVENKAEEVKIAKESVCDMQKELEETRASLRSSRDREEVFQKELESTRLKNRELQRDIDRMKRNSEQLHQAGNSLEQELEKCASETEEHKKKRMSAKHEIMQLVRTLESERAVSAKLKEAVKFTLTPKALSQQELLTECLRDFELELERLAAKTGKAFLPSAEKSVIARDESSNDSDAAEINDIPLKPKKSRSSKSDLDTERLISNLEQETQHVSRGIMSLAGDIERMRSLLNDDSMFSCMSYFSNILAGPGEAKHQILNDRSDSANYNENYTGRFI